MGCQPGANINYIGCRLLSADDGQQQINAISDGLIAFMQKQ